jgi:hypothetical protein
MVDVSIIIVNYNTKDMLRNCIDSIMEHTYDIDYEIIVVDNNSNDGSKEMLQSYYPNIKKILNDENLGFAKANNMALYISDGKYILFLNSDTRIEYNVILNMKNIYESIDKCGLLGCELLNKDGLVQQSYFIEFGLLKNFFKQIGITRLYKTLFMRKRGTYKVDWVFGACMFIRKDIVLRLKGFDESIFMYGEDMDLCYRVMKSGYKVLYTNYEHIIHYGGASSEKSFSDSKRAIMVFKGYIYFYSKHFSKHTAKIFIWSKLTEYSIKYRLFNMVYYISRNDNISKRANGNKMLYSALRDALLSI